MHKESQVFADLVRKVCPQPKHVVEVGVFMPQDSKIIEFIEDPAVRTSLFEPQSACYEALVELYGSVPNTAIYQVAIMDKAGPVQLQVPEARKGNPDAGASAFVQGMSSPFLKRGQRVRTEALTEETVPGQVFGYYDIGDIDALCVDTEGAEWFVLQSMVSRPKVISVEMGGPNAYINKYYDEIVDWMECNQYEEAHVTQEANTGHVKLREVFVADIIYTRK